ncbi:uncharacterized protein LOC124888869 [Capsicum annuum]|uniref:uncharacterized protein LOC124888869 n=1 Tax=Capsicum annuum TaxID=4072 RepID=UPI001FB12A8E|nr:uncharacterized protein LOC124888869 [Capsicum annuum]
MELWQSDDRVKKFEINSKNHYGGQEVVAGTHTGGSITVGEHREKLQAAGRVVILCLGCCYALLAVDMLVFPLYFGSICDAMERYEETVREKVQCESEIDQLETYYEATGGAKKKRLFGLRSEAASYFGKKLCTCNASTSSVPPSISIPTTNMEEFVKQLIPDLTTHFLSIVIKRVGGIRVQ